MFVWVLFIRFEVWWGERGKGMGGGMEVEGVDWSG